MKGSNVAKHQDMLARRREAEQMKIERTTAVNSYFDKWGRITSKYQHWTKPDYYEKVQQTVLQKKSEQQKSQQLDVRQNKLRRLLDDEKLALEQEAKEQKNGKAKKVASVEMLEGIHNALLRSEEEKRRLELESRLYRKWRHGEDRILHESKSNHEALAKMNWLDKQIDLQLERDKEQRESIAISLERERESRRHLELLQQRQQQRDDELRNLKSFQNNHIAELKAYGGESDGITAEIARLTHNQCKLTAELTGLNEAVSARTDRVQWPYNNTRRIKIMLKQRSDAVRCDLRDDMARLDRIDAYALDGRESLQSMRASLAQQSGNEAQFQCQIDAMYESEAKNVLVQQEQHWTDEANARQSKLALVMSEQLEKLQAKIDQLRRKQCDLVGMKQSHLQAIENANERLKDLMVGQRRDESEAQQVVGCDRDGRAGGETVTASSSASDLSDAPKFGRKKIAWT